MFGRRRKVITELEAKSEGPSSDVIRPETIATEAVSSKRPKFTYRRPDGSEMVYEGPGAPFVVFGFALFFGVGVTLSAIVALRRFTT